MKNCLAFLGLIFLFILSAAAVMMLPYFADDILKITGDFGYPIDIRSGPDLETRVTGESQPVITNLIENNPDLSLDHLSGSQPALPAPTLPPPPPTPTATPVPDPIEYRTRVMVRARLFSAALNAFLDTSNKLQGEPSLMENSLWRSEVRTALDEFVAATEDLSKGGPAPVEYQYIQGWLEEAGSHAAGLRANYLNGVETGDHTHFQAAGESFNRLVEAMQQAELAMIAAGWE
jgi:hypothetical protein